MSNKKRYRILPFNYLASIGRINTLIEIGFNETNLKSAAKEFESDPRWQDVEILEEDKRLSRKATEIAKRKKVKFVTIATTNEFLPIAYADMVPKNWLVRK